MPGAGAAEITAPAALVADPGAARCSTPAGVAAQAMPARWPSTASSWAVAAAQVAPTTATGDAADPPANPNLLAPLHRGCRRNVLLAHAGGGVVIVRARNITGSGTIDARGAHGYNVGNDAAGGGGAGGSVVLETPNGGGARIDVTGGDGGNAFANNATWAAGRHGPGGAGGGGFVAYAPSSMAVIAIVGGGTPGQTMSNSAAAGGPAVEYYGSEGFNGGITTFQSPNVPGAPQAALCDPILSLTKTDGVTSLISPNTVTYTLRVTNTGLSDSSGTVVIADRLPSGLTVVPGPLALSGVHAGQWTCNAANATDITCTSTSVVTASGGTKSFALAVALLAPDGTSIVNKAQLSGGGDPLKTTTATPAHGGHLHRCQCTPWPVAPSTPTRWWPPTSRSPRPMGWTNWRVAPAPPTR
jgi:uncharacterized repeat protein (TIGR01451 family)